MSNTNTLGTDHVRISQELPPDVGLALDEGDMQIRHMDSSKLDHSGSMVKLSRFQYEALKRHIYACHNRGK